MADKQYLKVKMELVDRPHRVIRDNIAPDEVRDLAESIREKGLKEPVLLRPKGGRFEVVAGDRRYLAHRLLSLDTIEAIVEEMTDEEAEETKAIENLQRVDLTPIETAKVYSHFKAVLGYSTEAVCRKMGRTHETVNKYLRLLELPQEFQEAINTKRLSIAAANQLIKIEDPEMRNYYLRAAVDNGVTVEVATRWAEEYNQSKLAAFNPMAGGGDGSALSGPSLPVYLTCHVCFQAATVGQIQYVPVCEQCRREIAVAQVEKGRG